MLARWRRLSAFQRHACVSYLALLTSISHQVMPSPWIRPFGQRRWQKHATLSAFAASQTACGSFAKTGQASVTTTHQFLLFALVRTDRLQIPYHHAAFSVMTYTPELSGPRWHSGLDNPSDVLHLPRKLPTGFLAGPRSVRRLCSTALSIQCTVQHPHTGVPHLFFVRDTLDWVVLAKGIRA